MKKNLLSLVLAITMIFPLPIFAGDTVGSQNDANNVETKSAVEETLNGSKGTESASSMQKETIKEEALEEAANATNMGDKSPDLDVDNWTSEDFTYTELDKTIYGCDYTRTVDIKGIAINGFSQQGEKKFATNKNIVLPAKDEKGNSIVGVAGSAFKDKGIESVVFPTGMLVSYDDSITHRVTRRGNFVIAESAFAGNKLTNVTLPEGVIAVLPNAFMNNRIKTVTLPRTIWWLETLSFARNKISKVNFPLTTYFQFEMHGMTFANNQIKSVRLPDYTAVVNKHVFIGNPGMEAVSEEGKKTLKNEFSNSGVVYMYTDNIGLASLDRIHTTDKVTANTKSWVQKLVTYEGTPETTNKDTESWNIDDFTVKGTQITGLTASGKAKRKVNKDLVIPDFTKEGDAITELADTDSVTGLFATADEKFDSVTLPMDLKRVGNNALRDSGLNEVAFSPMLTEIGVTAFQTNNIKSIVLPNSLKKLGNGAFATNPKLERIDLSNSLSEIPDSAFGCSDNKNWMANLTSIDIPESITKIGKRAFAGNNFANIIIPKNVTAIGDYAFSSKNYLLKDASLCEVKLPDGLKTIGNYAFRNKKISEINLPASVEALPKNVFAKEVTSSEGSTETYNLITNVRVKDISKYTDGKKFPKSDFHKIISSDKNVWNAEDFTYGDVVLDSNNSPAPAADNKNLINKTIRVVTGFTDTGKEKIATNKNLVIPVEDIDGNKVQGIGKSAFSKQGIESLKLPEDVKATSDGQWDTSVTTRGDFFINASAFSGNNLTELTLPEGVIYIGTNAFANNKLSSVKLPSTLMLIANGAFSKNLINTLEMPQTTDYPLSIDNMAFAYNKIESVQLPDKTEKVTKMAFIMNTGKEPVTKGTAVEKKGGIVYMYINEPGAFIDDVNNGKSNVQKLLRDQTIPAEESPWNAADFTFNDVGTVVTGLTDSGKAKLKKTGDIVVPDKGPNGTYIVAIGDGVRGDDGQAVIGTFGIREGDQIYVPRNVKLPETITQIGQYAFTGCIDTNAKKLYGISNINLPEGLQSVGMSAFWYGNLTSVELPDSVNKIGSNAFGSNDNLTKIVLSKALTEIPDNAFGKPVDTIAAIGVKPGIEEVVIPDGVISIGRNAFVGAKVKKLILPTSLEKIGDSAFKNHQLEEVTIPANVKSVDKNAFGRSAEDLAPTLNTLNLDEGFNGKIASGAFNGGSLKTIELPKSYKDIKNINKSAFKNNPAKVKLLTGDQEIIDAYKNLPNVETYTYTVDYDNLVGTGWNSGDFTYNDAGDTITGMTESGIAKRNGGNHNLVLPEVSPAGKEITTIGDKAFAISDKEAEIGKYESNSKNGFESVKFPSTLKSIGDNAFEYNMLKSLDLEQAKDLTSIGVSAFHGNHILKVHIPDTVNKLGEGAFSMNSIIDLRLSKNVTVIPQGAFSMNIRMREVKIPDTVTEIGQMAFAGARLETLEIPASVKKIDEKAFHLHHLTELTIPGTVKEIGDSAFEGTYKALTLTNLNIEEGVEKIGKYAFKEGLLTTVKLPKSIKTMGEEAFLNNTGTDANHVVILTTENPEHLKFNEKAKTHKVIMDKPMISFDANGGTVEPGYLFLNNENKVASLPTPKAGEVLMSFEGWFTERDGGKKVSANDTFKDGTKLFAHWKKDTNWNEDDFTVDGDKVTGLSENGKAKLALNPDLVIPDAIGGKVIKRIGIGAFSPAKINNMPINSVKLPGKLENIEQAAFSKTNIKELKLPETIEKIGKNAFNGSPIEEVVFSEGLKEIEDSAFGANKLTKVKLPDSLEKIGKYAFKVRTPEAATIKEVTFGKNLQSVGKEAFANQSIREIKISESLKEMPADVFKGNVVDGKDSKVKLISSNPEQKAGKGDYSKFMVKDPKATFYIPIIVKLDNNGFGNKFADIYADEQGTVKLPTPELPNDSIKFNGWSMKKDSLEKAPETFTEDTILYANWTFTPKEVSATEETTERDGNKQHWTSTDKDGTVRYFTDKDGKKEVKKSDVVIPRITYDFVEGKDAVWTKGDGDLVFRVKRSKDDENSINEQNPDKQYFSNKILVDGEELAIDSYIVEKGSVKVTLKKAYLEESKPGKHTLSVVYKDGRADTGFTVANKNTGSAKTTKNTVYKMVQAVRTGDDMSITFYLAILLVAGGALGAMAYYYRKRKAGK